MKRMILGTPLGRVALSVRDSMQMVGTACFRPENVGMIANDRLASLLVTRLCRADKVFIDAGCHIGSIVGEVTCHDPSVTVIGIEAIPEKADHLRRKFPRVEFHTCALADSEGEATFFINTRRSGYSSLSRPSDADGSHVTEIKVPLRTLDGLISSDEVDVIKIDVEGAELSVLRGGERLVAENRPTIMFESGPLAGDEGRGAKESLWQWFAERRYAVLVPNRVAHNDPGLSQEGFCESHLYPRRTTNYFAVANERRAEIQSRARGVLKLRG